MQVLRSGVDGGGSVAARGARDSGSGCASGILKASIDNTHTYGRCEEHEGKEGVGEGYRGR